MKKTFFLLGLLMLSLPLYGQWQLNGAAVCDTVGRQLIAANGIIGDGAGGAFIVWGDNRDDWDIFAQHVDSSGRMLWGRQGLAVCDYQGDQYAPRITADGEGGFVTAWFDGRGPAEVYAQRVDRQGKLLWPVDGVEVIKYTQFQGVEDVVMAADSAFIIVWRDDRFFPDSSAIFIQKLSRNGKKLWASDGVRVSDDPGSPRLLPDDRGGAFVFWAGGYVDGLVMQHITREGKRAWDMPGKIVSAGNASWNYSNLSVTGDGRGGAWLAWDHYHDEKAYIQRVDSMGNALLGESGIVIDEGETFFWPQVFRLSGDSVLVVWDDTYFNLQIFSGDGIPRFAKSKVLSSFKSAGFFSAAMDNAGHVLMFSAEILRYNPSQYILRAQKATTNGRIFWDSSGVVVSDVRISPSKMRGYVVADSAGGMVVAWGDNRYNNIETDIFSQRVYADGRAGGDTTTALGTGRPQIPASFDMKVFPNPFNGRVHIGFWLEKRQKIDMKVYDSSGRLVWEQNGYQGRPGKNRLAWDGRNSRGETAGSGLYIVSLSGERFTGARKTVLLK